MYFLIGTTTFAFLQIKDDRIWLSVREDYGRLSELCAVLNKSLRNLTFLILDSNTSMALHCVFEAVV